MQRGLPPNSSGHGPRAHRRGRGGVGTDGVLCNGPEHLGPFPGESGVNIVFLVEGQQGARREKSNTSVSVGARSGALHSQALFYSPAPSPARPDRACRRGRGSLCRRLGSRSCTSSSRSLPSARKGEGRPPSLAGRARFARTDRQPDDGMEEARSCDVSGAERGPSFAFPSAVAGLGVSPGASRGCGVEVADGR